MRDPHVTKLHYKVTPGEGISYRDPKPITFSNELGVFELRDGNLSVAPAEHFAEANAACRAMDSFLKAWEIEPDLTSNFGMIRFKFERADVEDRNPPPPGSAAIKFGAASIVATSDFGAVGITCAKYPGPPKAFSTTSEVEGMYRRWVKSREGRGESLPSIANFVLTRLEHSAGGRKRAARTFQISIRVLNKMATLGSKGDEMTARKAPKKKGEPFQALTQLENAWLNAAVRRVIHRMGEHASGAPLTMITFADVKPIL